MFGENGMGRIHPNMIIGGVLLIFSVVVYLIIPIEIQALMRYDASMGLSPAVFPKFSVFLIAGFSVVLILSGLRSKDVIFKEDRRTPRLGNRTRVITAFAILVAYVYLLGIIGYLLLTPLALAFLMWYFGERRWFVILSVVILTTTGLFYFFRYIMYIILPEGI
ncbi:MAG: hypothetical protein GTO12_21580, partial [Proteobacteria bacterium]|nr:hypothetical protein [Pseudomonadota bacterium]